jgi:toxin-antitoxin system PIN domain toxin
VKLLDANILLYAYDARSAQHDVCRAWLTEVLNEAEPVGLPWQTMLAFVRIATNSRAVQTPIPVSQACAIVDSWLQRPQVVIVEPGDRYWGILREQLAQAKVSGPLVTDASLAALALEQGATLCTTDRDFLRFSALKRLDPTQDL